MRRNYHFFWLPLLVLVSLFPLEAAADSQRGDANGDGKVNITDVTFLINNLLSGDNSSGNAAADVNADGILSITDVAVLIDHLLNGSELPPLEPQVLEFSVGGVTFAMVRVEGGTFSMGATPEQGHDASRARRQNRHQPIRD